MVMHDFNIVRTRFPAEANAPLVTDTDSVLPDASTLQRLQPLAWRRPQVLQLRRCIQL